MRIFALSDIHIDYSENAKWLAALPHDEYKDDVLILAGDISDSLALVEWCFHLLVKRFARVCFVPGNHDLWVIRDTNIADSLQKLDRLLLLARQCHVSTDRFHLRGISIVPLLAWYDYSFGRPSSELQAMWMDYRACAWPPGYSNAVIASYFDSLNDQISPSHFEKVISFSHFVPRVDLIPSAPKTLYPVLGTYRIEEQIRRVKSSIHVFGHSHINRWVNVDGVVYINNAFGYPSEHRTAKKLTCIYEA